MASAMPVLPVVASMIRWPGRRSPRSLARSSMNATMRSLVEPLGFWPSSFAKMRTPGLGLQFFSSTSGVFPTRPSTESTHRV